MRPGHCSNLSCLSAALVLLVCTLPAFALEQVRMDLALVSGETWRLDGVRTTIQLTDGGLTFQAHAEGLAVNDKLWLQDIALRCLEPELNPRYLVCTKGRAEFTVVPADERLGSSLDFVFRRADGRWRATGSVTFEQSAMAWRVEGDRTGLQAALKSDRLELASLLPWIQSLYSTLSTLSGHLQDVELRLRFPKQGPVQGSFSLAGDQLGFDTEQGRVAAAGVGLDVTGRFRALAEGWRFGGELEIDSGQFLFGSFYTQLGGTPASLDLAGSWSAARGLQLDSFTVTDPDAVRLTGSGRLDWSADALIQRLELSAKAIHFPGFYRDYLQPVLAQFGFGELNVRGSATGSVTIRKNQLEELNLELTKINAADAKERLEFTHLDGRVSWQRGGPPTVSQLSWDQARLYRIDLGPVLWRVRSRGGDFALLEATTLPVFDGALQIHEFKVEDLFSEAPGLLFDATLEPISLGALTRALGWPEMSGQLAGRIPKLTLEGDTYRLGGALIVNVFDGLIRVSNLRLERPFGVLPKLVADVEIDNLDLARITSVFTVGKIRGRLGGYVRNLRLLNWLPVHFDAKLATPLGDKSKHRISQRAVETLSSLGGGGATGALSGMFLRLFDDFGYEKLGLSCYLDDTICSMGGVAPAPGGGYYIVKGSGIPRVDVIGYVERVDWPRLIEQLVLAMQGQTPTIGEPDS